MHRAISAFIDWVRPLGEKAKAARDCEQRFTMTRSHCDQVGTATSHLSRNFRDLHRPPRFLAMDAGIANTKAITSSGRNNRFGFPALARQIQQHQIHAICIVLIGIGKGLFLLICLKYLNQPTIL